MARSYAITDTGRRRKNNEDAVFCDDALGLFAVCDGVGGRAKGEVASEAAVEQLSGYVKQGKKAIDAFLTTPSAEHSHDVRRLLEGAVQNACYMIFGLAELDPTQKGMATTLSALLLVGGVAYVAQVGDSRIYLMRDGRATQLTEDHTLINDQVKMGLVTASQAESMPGKNVITRAVGNRDYVEVDLTEVAARPGDQFLLCSDGLHGYLQPGEIEVMMNAADPGLAASQFVQMANERGGKDNITVIVVSL